MKNDINTVMKTISELKQGLETNQAIYYLKFQMNEPWNNKHAEVTATIPMNLKNSGRSCRIIIHSVNAIDKSARH